LGFWLWPGKEGAGQARGYTQEEGNKRAELALEKKRKEREKAEWVASIFGPIGSLGFKKFVSFSSSNSNEF
jgi:hypothetical protein